MERIPTGSRAALIVLAREGVHFYEYPSSVRSLSKGDCKAVCDRQDLHTLLELLLRK